MGRGESENEMQPVGARKRERQDKKAGWEGGRGQRREPQTKGGRLVIRNTPPNIFHCHKTCYWPLPHSGCL